MIREALAADKVGLTGDALDRLRRPPAPERGVVRQEIERLALLPRPGLRRQPSTPPSWSASWASSRRPRCPTPPSDAFGGRLGPGPGRPAPRRSARARAGPAAVRAVGMHLGKLRRIADPGQGRRRPKEAAKAAGVFWKQEREFLRQARAWTLDDLDRVQPDVLAADRACKTDRLARPADRRAAAADDRGAGAAAGALVPASLEGEGGPQGRVRRAGSTIKGWLPTPHPGPSRPTSLRADGSRRLALSRHESSVTRRARAETQLPYRRPLSRSRFATRQFPGGRSHTPAWRSPRISRRHRSSSCSSVS